MNQANDIVDMLNKYIFSVEPVTPVAYNDTPRRAVIEAIAGLLIEVFMEQGLPLEDE